MPAPNHYTMYTSAQRPLTAEETLACTSQWPEFMMRDPLEVKLWPHLLTQFANFQFALFNGLQIMGLTNTIPLSMDLANMDYNQRGWDWALEKGFADKAANKAPTVLCGLQISINGEFKGQGLSALFINGMKTVAQKHGLKAVILPIRPTLKHKYPLISMQDYITWQNDAGLPFDPWIRTHVKAGAKIMGICDRAMHIYGSIAQWRQWTRLSFQSSGQYIAEGALAPITADIEKDYAEYVEPNLWVRHNF